MLSMTIVDKSGRNLSGQLVDAWYTSIEHAHPLSVGINCSLGGNDIRPYVEELAGLATEYVSCYPNAGLPNALGEFDETPEITARLLRGMAEEGLLNFAGGCCGTTPDHIRAIARAMEGVRPRKPAPPAARASRASAASRCSPSGPTSNFQMIGERTNVTGSAKFMELVKKGDYQTGTQVALEQVKNGANIVDVNMDEGMLDGAAAMTTFLNIIATEPEIARVPVMIDSSKFEVILAGLKCVQGKAIVNSISLKEGEADFLEKAAHRAPLRRRRRRHGLRRAGPGRQHAAPRRDLQARLHAPHREGAASIRATSSSTRTSSPSRRASRSTPSTRRASSRRCRSSRRRAPA